MVADAAVMYESSPARWMRRDAASLDRLHAQSVREMSAKEAELLCESLPLAPFVGFVLIVDATESWICQVHKSLQEIIDVFQGLHELLVSFEAAQGVGLRAENARLPVHDWFAAHRTGGTMEHEMISFGLGGPELAASRYPLDDVVGKVAGNPALRQIIIV